MAWRILIAASARRALMNLPDDAARRIERAIDALADEPRPPGAHKLQGAEDLYRVRVGAHRIVYRIENRVITVTVVRVGHRRDVYRQRFGR